MTDDIISFCAERGWNEGPSDLALWGMIELGELADYCVGKTSFDEFSDYERLAVSHEAADVVFHLFRLLRHLDIDLKSSFDEKLSKLKKKYPIGVDPRQQHYRYRLENKNTQN
ncbi:MAG: hypothetical protein GY861_22235 [bacterium]|nr:hypothetical protein [bacterium]